MHIRDLGNGCVNNTGCLGNLLWFLSLEKLSYLSLEKTQICFSLSIQTFFNDVDMVVVVVRRGRGLSSAPRVQISAGFSSPVPTLFRFPASFVFLFVMLFCFRVWKPVVVVLRRHRRWCWCYLVQPSWFCFHAFSICEVLFHVLVQACYGLTGWRWFFSI
jgi:hypothetical protein